jgi:hypothetical protein
VDGQAILGVGIGILGFTGPIAAVIVSRAMRNGGPKPGTATTCVQHAKQLVQLHTTMTDHLKHNKEALDRIESRLAAFEQKLDARPRQG